ncbi:putative reverse transcriptase domain-containing protein [Tanacetum coccineum]
MGMDWLSKRKFVIVCHEKVVRIPLEGDEILRVHGERTQGVVKTLMNTKSKEKHEVHLKLVLESLRKEKLYAKFSKSEFWLEEVNFLGHVVNHNVFTWTRAFKQENVLTERLRGLDQQMERKGDESLYFMDRIWVLLVGTVMDEAHASRYLVHPRVDKTYYNLRDMYCLRYLSENEIESPWNLSLNFQGQSSKYDHPQSDGQSERMIQTLEDIMRACVIDFGGSYHLTIQCAPFEALYKRKCRSPVLWAVVGESSLTGLERKPLEFEVGDRVLLKVTPWKGVVCFGKKAYRLRLPKELNSVYNTFHVSNLKKCLVDASLHVPLDEIKVDKTLCFVEELVEIMDREIKKLKRRKIELLKVRWNSKRVLEFTKEHKDQLRIKYPQLFVDRVVEPAS